MKILIQVAAALFLSAPVLVRASNFVPDEVLVRYSSNLQPSALRGNYKTVYESTKRLKVLAGTGQGPLLQMKTQKGESVADAIARFRKDPRVVSVQPNFIYKKMATVPNDSLYGYLWGIKNTGQDVYDPDYLGPDFGSTEDNPGTAGVDLGLEAAWDRITDCSSTVVAVIDTGIKYDHEDLAANMWDGSALGFPNHGYDFHNSDNNPMDDDGHGTHVAGTIGAVGNNGKGITGVCWKVKLMALKALSSAGGTTANVISSLNWAVDKGAHVVNMSLGGGGSSDPVFEAALEAANTSNVIVIIAAGNDGANNDSLPTYPCNYKKANTLCVAALTQKNELASFSNYGATSVDVGAPGVNIASTWHLSRTAVSDTFATGWNISTNTATTWGAQTFSSGPTLTIPSNWNGTNNYVNSTQAKAYKSFNFAGIEEVWLRFYVLTDLLTGDRIRSYAGAGAGDPTGGTAIGTYEGDTNGDAYGYIYRPTTACANATCAVGFRFDSDASGTSTGGLVAFFETVRFAAGTSGYNLIEGTSMATPQVAGIVAMIRSRNPTFSKAEILESLLAGGKALPSLAGKTTSGKAINAASALAYLRAPTGVSVQKVTE